VTVQPTAQCSISIDSEFVPVSRDASAERSGHINIWVVPFALLRTQGCQLHRLSNEERTRAWQKRTPHSARNFSLARSYLRSVLASQMICGPEDINIEYSSNGKPVVADGPAFNVSHCEQLLLVSVADNEFVGEVGVDVEERVATNDTLRLADRYFADSERMQLKTYPNGLEKRIAFTRGWTRKEAVIKAMGNGLSTPLDKFAVSLEAKSNENKDTLSRSQLLLASDLEGISRKSCHLFDLGSRFGCEMSVAIVPRDLTISVSVSVHDVNESQLKSLAEFCHG